MDMVLPHLNVVVLFMSGVGAAVVLFVAIGLLLDVVPREAPHPQDQPAVKQTSWLWRLFHPRLSH